MAQAQRNPGGSSPRESGGTSRAGEQTLRSQSRQRPVSEDREIERARHRRNELRDGMQEGDEGQGEWESSARSW